MMNLQLNHNTKVFAFFRNEIVKRDRKSRVKKINKDKVSVLRNSSMFKKLRAFMCESESQSESKYQSESKSQRFVINSFIVVFASIDNATLLKMFFYLLSFSFNANFSSIIFITIFVIFVIVLITIFEMIKIVDDLNMNDIDVLLKKYDHAQTKLFRFDIDVSD
jgi:hypothetical protein